MATDPKGDIHIKDEVQDDWNTDIRDPLVTRMVPLKSKARYEKTYSTYKQWVNEQGVKITEKTLLDYFIQRSKKLKSPGSLWAEYSMLKTTIHITDGIDISTFYRLLTFLRKKNVGHCPKKSKVFRREEVTKFLTEAPDQTYLMMKVAMIMGIAGSCRRDELINMKLDDIEDRGSVILVNVPNRQKDHHRQTFTIVNRTDENVNMLDIVRKYIKMRPKTCSSRLFYALRAGKCVNQVVGINTMGRVPLKIAEYLKLEDPSSYTGHAFRRTSTTLYSNFNIMGVENRMELPYCRILPKCSSNPNNTDVLSTTSNTMSYNNNQGISNSFNCAKSINLEIRNQSVPITFNNCSNCTFNINLK